MPVYYRRHLPHWRMGGATYFVTWRLNKCQQELLPDERSLIVKALRHFDGQRYDVVAYVVMDDHVHVLVTPRAAVTLAAVLHTWKSFTAHQLQRQFGRRGRVWQDESFDRVIRNSHELGEKAGYILDNPKRRWPNLGHYPWVTGAEACPTGEATLG